MNVPRFSTGFPRASILARIFCPRAEAVVLLSLLAWVARLHAAPCEPGANGSSAAIPLDQIGAVAARQYQGDGLTVSETENGAVLRCVFQKLTGQVTRQGLWLTSTAEESKVEMFRVVATAVGRTASFGVRRQSAAATPLFDGERLADVAPASESGVALRFSPHSKALPRTGTVEVAGNVARFIRPGLTEEYRVSVDGVQQDFIIAQRPGGQGQLRVDLDVAGARAEPLADGARLVLEGSGRKLNYHRVRVTDATGKELPARMEVTDVRESQRDSISQPRVASLRATLGQAHPQVTTLKALCREAHRGDQHDDATPLGLTDVLRGGPRVARRTRNPGLTDAIPSGLGASTEDSVDTRDAGTLKQPEGRAPLAVWVHDEDAVYPVRIDPTFSDANWISLPGANGQVFAAAVDGSGNLYIGGYFTVVGDVMANRIAKWDGSSWSALGSGINGPVYALAVSGSDLYAGGAFTTAGGKVSAYIARAYLLPLPALSVRRSGTEVMVSWPSADTAGFGLEQAGTLAAPASWVTNTASITNDGTNKSVTLSTTNSQQFFRLRKP